MKKIIETILDDIDIYGLIGAIIVPIIFGAIGAFIGLAIIRASGM